MTELNSHETRNIYPNLNDQQQFKLNSTNEIKDYFIAEIKERELMSKRRSKYIAFFYYIDKSLFVLSVTTGSIFIASFATVIGAPVRIVSSRFCLPFSAFTEILKKLLKTRKNKKKKHDKDVMLARSKLNSIESKISEALINSENSHENFMAIINNEKKYRELKETIRMMNSQKSDTEEINVIEEGKKIGIDEVNKQNEVITMPPYCLKCRKNTTK